MDDLKLDKIKDDVNDIKVSLAKIESTLERNTESLIEHVKRTNLLEDKVEVLKDEVTPVLKDIKPVLKYWKILSLVVVISVTSANPKLIPLILKLFGL